MQGCHACVQPLNYDDRPKEGGVKASYTLQTYCALADAYRQVNW